MKSTDVLGPRQRGLWKVLRSVIPPRLRWYYEGHPSIRGQLWFSERRLLYRTIRKYRPRLCFEIGTWKGGGSTLFIAQALHDNAFGEIHTIEVDKSLFAEAQRNYEQFLPELLPRVRFHLGDYRKVYGRILESEGRLDFLLLDGAENAEETLRQLEFFLPYLKSGSVLMAHDWFTTKCALLRSEVERSGQWHVLSVLPPPWSVGLLLAVRRDG